MQKVLCTSIKHRLNKDKFSSVYTKRSMARTKRRNAFLKGDTMWLDVGAIVFWVGLIGWLIYSHFPKKSSGEYSQGIGMMDCDGVAGGCPEEKRRRRRRSFMY